MQGGQEGDLSSSESDTMNVDYVSVLKLTQLKKTLVANITLCSFSLSEKVELHVLT